MEERPFMPDTSVRKHVFASSPAQSSSSSLGGWSEDSSSCQNSSSSTDSGRGSDSSSRTATIHGCYNRYSQLSSPQFSSSSSSSSSLFSSPPTFAQGKSLVLPTPLQTRPDAQSPGPPTWGVGKSGTTHSASLLICWLDSLQFSCYHSLFLSAGYDLPTISRMTPEDLTAIGIQHPGHRKKLKQAISQLNIPDGLPDFLPDSLADWLRMIRLEEYGPGLLAQGYNTVKDVVTISIEDLEDVGFYRLGHQKRLLLAIKKMKDICKVYPRKNAENYSYSHQTQCSNLPALQPGNMRPAFSSFHHGVSAPDHAAPISPNTSCKLPTLYLAQSDLRHRQNSIPTSCNPNLIIEPVTGKQEDMLPAMPEPMQPLPQPLYLLDRHMYTETSAPKYQSPQRSFLTPIRDSQNFDIKRRVLQQTTNKERPIAKVAATARNCQKECEPPELETNYGNEVASNKEFHEQNKPSNQIYKIRYDKQALAKQSLIVRRNSLTGCEGLQNTSNIRTSQSPAIMRRKTLCDSSPNLTITCEKTVSPPSDYKKPRKTRTRSAGDVLQDIGCMLSELTSELDAMLDMDQI